jgi:hypothetical protein
MSLLTKAAILAANDLPTRDVAVPEWGGSVRIRSMTAEERDAFEAAQIAAKTDGFVVVPNLRARYVSSCIVGEDGQPLFSEGEIGALGRKSAAALDRVFSAIAELNKLDPNAIEEAAGK